MRTLTINRTISKVVFNYSSATTGGVKARKEIVDGREYLVAPMTLIVSGVLNGSKGALYYPPEEVAKNYEDWNDIPIVVYHPTRNGRNVSAFVPGILDEVGIGHLSKVCYNPKTNKLTSLGYFDIERTRKVDERVYNALVRGESMEISTGLFTSDEESPGIFNGKDRYGRAVSREYRYIARNYRPDHLAVLPDQRGACSLEDGCGLLVNKEKKKCCDSCEEGDECECLSENARSFDESKHRRDEAGRFSSKDEDDSFENPPYQNWENDRHGRPLNQQNTRGSYEVHQHSNVYYIVDHETGEGLPGDYNSKEEALREAHKRTIDDEKRRSIRLTSEALDLVYSLYKKYGSEFSSSYGQLENAIGNSKGVYDEIRASNLGYSIKGRELQRVGRQVLIEQLGNAAESLRISLAERPKSYEPTRKERADIDKALTAVLMAKDYHTEILEGGIVENVFCPTGKGGGVDPSCKKGESTGYVPRTGDKEWMRSVKDKPIGRSEMDPFIGEELETSEGASIATAELVDDLHKFVGKLVDYPGWTLKNGWRPTQIAVRLQEIMEEVESFDSKSSSLRKEGGVSWTKNPLNDTHSSLSNKLHNLRIVISKTAREIEGADRLIDQLNFVSSLHKDASKMLAGNQDVSINAHFFSICDRNEKGWCLSSDEGGSYGGSKSQERILRESIDDDPSDSLAWRALADYHEENGNEEEAERVRVDLATREKYVEEVQGPGKFEGQEPYVPYFYDENPSYEIDPEEDLFEDDDGVMDLGYSPIQVYEVTDKDRRIFPELKNRERVYLDSTGDGFVYEVDEKDITGNSISSQEV